MLDCNAEDHLAAKSNIENPHLSSLRAVSVSLFLSFFFSDETATLNAAGINSCFLNEKIIKIRIKMACQCIGMSSFWKKNKPRWLCLVI